MTKEKNPDLEDRFVDYSVRIIKLSDALPNTRAGQHVGLKVLGSGTSPAPDYGEAQSAESRADSIHNLEVALKELRETRIWLKVILRSGMIIPDEDLSPLIQETGELISILCAKVETARKNQ